MQDKSKDMTPVPTLHPLKALTRAEFAALGAPEIVFEREISANGLARLLPAANIQSEAETFYLVISADGTPIFVTDSSDAVEDWLDESDVELAAVH